MTNHFDNKYDLQRILDAGGWECNPEVDVIWPKDATEDLNGFEVWIREATNTLVVDVFTTNGVPHREASEFHIDEYLTKHLDEMWDTVVGWEE